MESKIKMRLPCNGLAFLLGANNPNAASPSFLPNFSREGNDFSLSFTMRNAANSGSHTLSIEHSSDLGAADAWASVPVPESDSTNSGVSFAITPGATTNAVRATISGSHAGGGKLFSRIRGHVVP